MGTHPIFESDFDCLTDRSSFRTFERNTIQRPPTKDALLRRAVNVEREMVEEYEENQSRAVPNGDGCDEFGSRPKTIDVSSCRAGNVFDSFTNREKGGEDRKIPRQARHPIQRKETEGNTAIRKRSNRGSPSNELTNELNGHNNEFRDRSQTAPSVIMKRLRAKTDELTSYKSQKDNNNTEDSQEEIGGAMEMPKQLNETKKQQKHRFPFKKNRDKENSTKDESSNSKSRSRRTRADGQITPKTDYPSGTGGDAAKTNSAAAGGNQERRRRTRRRRGNRKSGSNTGLDNEQMDQMSLEEALNALQDTREGQTWQHDENLQCQVINGTTYFTPVSNYSTKESDQCMSLPNELTNEHEYGNEGWSQNSGSSGYLNEAGMFSMKVEEFRPRTLSHRQISQSEPMGRRTVKEDGYGQIGGKDLFPNAGFSSETLKEKLKEIWAETKKGSFSNSTESIRTGFGQNTAAEVEETETMTAIVAEEMASVALEENNESGSKINDQNISKLWGSNNSRDSSPKDIREPDKPTYENENMWQPERIDLLGPMGNVEVAGRKSPLIGGERHLGLRAPVSDGLGGDGLGSSSGGDN